MRGFGHDKGNKVFTWSHDSRDQNWVAGSTHGEVRGAVATQEPGLPSSIYMWAYGVEICFSPSASKNFYSIHPHIVPKGRGHAFNGSIYL